MAMFKWWDVVPDDEQQHWMLDPFVTVGPLRFGMSPGEVVEVLSGLTGESQRHKLHLPAAEPMAMVVEGEYRKFELKLYYRQERLAGVVVDALRGPQVLADGMATVGRIPSVVEQWMLDRAEAREPNAELSLHGRGCSWVGVAGRRGRCAAGRRSPADTAGVRASRGPGRPAPLPTPGGVVCLLTNRDGREE
ncbi:hypothetical protein ABUW04_12015 [Streptacidiphilus sp. N1-10]|uniref:Uncharacterized protein n=1 Tax=Streptacidiphilus jeojiensis TaxID=3229225 RepID=A0ABV6XM26_9ACTN